MLSIFLFLLFSIWVIWRIVVYFIALVWTEWNIKHTTNVNNERVKNNQEEYIKTSYIKRIKSIIRSWCNSFLWLADKYTRSINSRVLRRWLYKHVFKVKMGKGSVLYGGLEIRSGYDLKIGDRCIIGHNCILDARQKMEIGNDVNISNDVWIWTEQHDTQDPLFRCNPEKYKKVVIKDRVWLSNGVKILPGVTIGEGAVVACGSVVTHDVEPFTIVGGIPAKYIGERNRDLKYNLGKETLHFV